MDAFLIQALYEGDTYNLIYKAKSITKALKRFKRECDYDLIVFAICLGENLEVDLY